MKQGSAVDFLVRTVLDEAFRKLALAHPQRAFEGYDLTDEQKEILRRRDHRLLGLLGDAVAPEKAGVQQTLDKEEADVDAPAPPDLPEVKLLLRLVPQASSSPDSGPDISYAVSLHAWPGDDDRTTGSDTANRTETGVGGDVGEVSWLIRIAPTVVESQAAGLRVAYFASIHPLMTDPDRTRRSARERTGELASPPWNHHVGSSAAKTAARAVHAADPSQRYHKLLDLVHALQTGDDGG
jgi:hypothetical protein